MRGNMTNEQAIIEIIIGVLILIFHKSIAISNIKSSKKLFNTDMSEKYAVFTTIFVGAGFIFMGLFFLTGALDALNIWLNKP